MEFLESFSKLGISAKWITVISVIISIVLFVIRLSPVTLFTSDHLERRLYSKEKNFIIKAFWIFTELVVTVIVMTAVTYMLVENKRVFTNSIVELILFAVILVFLGVTLGINFKTGKTLIASSEKWELTNKILSVLFLVSIYILPILFVGRTIIESYQIENSFEFKAGIFLAVLFMYSIIAISYTAFIRAYFDLTGLRDLGFENKRDPLYIILGAEKWYLQYPIDKHSYYLSNEKFIKRSTKLKLIPLADLRKETFFIEQEPRRKARVYITLK